MRCGDELAGDEASPKEEQVGIERVLTSVLDEGDDPTPELSVGNPLLTESIAELALLGRRDQRLVAREKLLHPHFDVRKRPANRGTLEARLNGLVAIVQDTCIGSGRLPLPDDIDRRRTVHSDIGYSVLDGTDTFHEPGPDCGRLPPRTWRTRRCSTSPRERTLAVRCHGAADRASQYSSRL